MTHEQEISRILQEHNFPMEKILFYPREICFYNKETKELQEVTIASHINRYKMSLLSTGSESLMNDFRARVRKSEKTIIYILDASPCFYPAIKNNSFEFVKVVFVRS